MIDENLFWQLKQDLGYREFQSRRIARIMGLILIAFCCTIVNLVLGDFNNPIEVGVLIFMICALICLIILAILQAKPPTIADKATIQEVLHNVTKDGKMTSSYIVFVQDKYYRASPGIQTVIYEKGDSCMFIRFGNAKSGYAF